MNKKQIIQIIIIVGAFLGAGIVLYNGFFKSNSAAVEQSASPETAAQTPADILPYGANLDWSVLQRESLIYNQVAYPQLDPNNDYGVPVDNLIVAPSTPAK